MEAKIAEILAKYYGGAIPMAVEMIAALIAADRAELVEALKRCLTELYYIKELDGVTGEGQACIELAQQALKEVGK